MVKLIYNSWLNKDKFCMLNKNNFIHPYDCYKVYNMFLIQLFSQLKHTNIYDQFSTNIDRLK